MDSRKFGRASVSPVVLQFPYHLYVLCVAETGVPV